MTKTSRLLRLMQVLRGCQRPITAQQLSERLSVSVRTVYRDVQALVELGASIEGSAGLGYMLRSGFFLPPLMFSDEELEALVLGTRWVEGQGDAELAHAAKSALVKIANTSPKNLQDKIAEIGLYGPRPSPSAHAVPNLGVIRMAIRLERKVSLQYFDAGGVASERVVWPVALGYFEGIRVVAAWCELRTDFRHFRVDRIADLHALDVCYPKTRRQLLAAWKLHCYPDAHTRESARC